MAFSHLDQNNQPQMISVLHKDSTTRIATASTKVVFPQAVWENFREGDIQGKKGPVGIVAQIAGIQGAKLTSQLIPMCHPLFLDRIHIEYQWDEKEKSVTIYCTVTHEGKTGVEMEALTGASICALTFYDMCKALSQEIQIGPTYLVNKTGGKSDYHIKNTPKN